MTGYQEFFLITKIPVGRQLPEISAISVSFALAHIRYNNNYVKSQTEPVGKKAGSRSRATQIGSRKQVQRDKISV